MDLKIKDVADLLKVSETTIRRWLADGSIPAYRINQQYRFNLSEIEDWLLNQKKSKGEEISTFSDMSQEGPQGNKQFSLYRAIHKGCVIAHIPGNNKEQVIRNTMKSIAGDMNLDAEVVTELLLDRENLQSTGLNNGIAIPHTRDCLLNEHHDVVAVVFPEKPLPYDSLDGLPVHTLFFLFACDDKHHLHLLAKIAHLSGQPSAQQFLQSKPSKEALLAYIKEWESKIQ